MKTILFIIFIIGSVFLILNLDYFSNMSDREIEVLIKGVISGSAYALIIAIIAGVISFIGKTINKSKAKLKNSNTVEDDIIFVQITEELKRRDINEVL